MTEDKTWLNKAAFCELMASSFRYVSHDVASACVSGEYADALLEIGSLNGIDEGLLLEWASPLKAYGGLDAETVMHALRREHTRLFIGGGAPVPAYAGVWKSVSEGKPALYMVSKESMDIERFMRRCGVGRPEGTNEPIDHIASILEFLYFLCLVKARAVKPAEHARIEAMDYEVFFSLHAHDFICALAAGVLEHAREPFFICAAHALLGFAERPR